MIKYYKNERKYKFLKQLTDWASIYIFNRFEQPENIPPINKIK